MKPENLGTKSDEIGRGAIKAMEFSDEEAMGFLVRGNLQAAFVKKWAGRAVLAFALYYLLGRRILTFVLGGDKNVVFVSWPMFAALVVAGIIVLYVIGARWARREYERYDSWVDCGDSYRPVLNRRSESGNA